VPTPPHAPRKLPQHLVGGTNRIDVIDAV